MNFMIRIKAGAPRWLIWERIRARGFVWIKHLSTSTKASGTANSSWTSHVWVPAPTLSTTASSQFLLSSICPSPSRGRILIVRAWFAHATWPAHGVPTAEPPPFIFNYPTSYSSCVHYFSQQKPDKGSNCTQNTDSHTAIKAKKWSSLNSIISSKSLIQTLLTKAIELPHM